MGEITFMSDSFLLFSSEGATGNCVLERHSIIFLYANSDSGRRIHPRTSASILDNVDAEAGWDSRKRISFDNHHSDYFGAHYPVAAVMKFSKHVVRLLLNQRAESAR